MLIKGLQKLTLLDFPGRIACTVFTFGCNFRCPFCHNASLVLKERDLGGEYTEAEIFSFLQKRRGMLEGVCISGGEPTLMPDLEPFIRRVRELGYAVKLDTNGYRPEVLRHLTDGGLIDYVAMDIKNCREKYAATVGIPDFDIGRIDESLRILKEGKVPYELRTTVVRELHSEEDMRAIGRWLGDVPAYYLQGYEDSGDVLGEGYSAYTPEEMRSLLAAVRDCTPSAKLRIE
jgi:pyruvate formate lyase activating enzyme